MAKKKKEYYVYVIRLKPEFAKTKKAKKHNPNFLPGPNKRCYYVGYTSKSPEVRHHQHITQYINKKGYNLSSSVVYKYGYSKNGLRPEQYEKYNPIDSKTEAEKLEMYLADRLRKKGHCVYQA